MTSKSKTLFLFLIIAQECHSFEEYWFALWEVFLPARIVSGLLTTNLTAGFVIVNSLIVAFGFWTYLVPVRRSEAKVPAIVWFWVLLEFGNAVGHIWFSISEKGYFPGIISAPFLLAFSVLLAVSIMKTPRADNYG